MKYERIYDSQIFDEDIIHDAVNECIQPDDIEIAMQEFSVLSLFNHLDDEMRERVFDVAYRNALDDYFYEIEEEEEE